MNTHSATLHPSADEGPIIDNRLYRCVRPVVLRFLAAGWISGTIIGTLLGVGTTHVPTYRWFFFPLYGFVCVSLPAFLAWLVMEWLWNRLPRSSMALWLLPGASALWGFVIGAAVDLRDTRWTDTIQWGAIGAACAVASTMVNHVFFRPMPLKEARITAPVKPETRRFVRILVGTVLVVSALLTIVSCVGYLYFFFNPNAM